jgi:lipoprotein-releasing system permease protein
MSFELSVACRYLLTRSQAGLRLSPISLISIIGVGVGVMAVIIALALMTGLQGELRDRILGATSHVYVWKVGGIEDYRAEVERLRAIADVTGAAPAIIGRAMISTERADAFISLKGIDPSLEQSVTDIGRSMLQGSVEALAAQPADGLPGILIGRNLADTLGVGVGDTAQLLTQQGTLTPFGPIPRPRPVRIVGVYALGLYEFDAAYGFISLDFSERLLGKAVPDLIELRVANMDDAPAVSERVVTELGRAYSSQDWTDMNQTLFSALWIEKVAISLTVGLIVMVAALNIIASLILLVIEKGRDIGILKTMGTSSAQVTRIFMLQGVIIGLVGTTVGAAIAVSLCWVLDRYRLISIPMDVYQVSYVPFVVLPLDFVIVVITSVGICFLATLYPSRQAARLDPVQALRFE